MAISIAQLADYMNADLNILITGEAGTAKTAKLKAAAEQLGLKMKYYSASTLDPFADLVGIPVPDKETRTVDYYRPREVDEAEVIFFDELNRADPKTLNTVFEISQFGTINGEPLPKLKCVVAAMNPVTEDYETEELDIALRDRFDVFLETEVEADYEYLKTKFPVAYARAGVSLFREYQEAYQRNRELASSDNKLGYFSPRRLEKLMDIYRKFPKEETIRAVLPPDVSASVKAIHEVFTEALTQTDNPKINKGAEAAQRAMGYLDPEAAVAEQLAKGPSEIRSKRNVADFMAAYEWAKANDAQKAARLRNTVALGLANQVGVDTLTDLWMPVLMDFNPTERRMLMSGWDFGKRSKLEEFMGW